MELPVDSLLIGRGSITVTLRTNSWNEFKVNGQRLKHYLRGILKEKQSQIRRE